LFCQLEVPGMMLLAGAGLLVGLGFTWMANQAFRYPPTGAARKSAEKPLGKEGGFELALKNHYLTLVALLIFLLNVVNTTGEYILSSFVVEQRRLWRHKQKVADSPWVPLLENSTVRFIAG